MDFAATEAASQFIELVSIVCPCTVTDRAPRANRGPPQATLTNSQPRLTPKKPQKPAPSRPKKAAGTQARPPSAISVGSDDSHTLTSGSSDPLPEAFPVHSNLASQLAAGQAFPPSFAVPLTPSQNDISSQPAIPRLFHPSQTFLPSTPIPSSSQMLPPTAPITPQSALQSSTRPQNVQPDVFLESLMESPTLYDLSKSQLEVVVAQVIREEGFVKLVCVRLQRLYFVS